MTHEGATGLKIPAQQRLLTSAHEGPTATPEAPSPSEGPVGTAEAEGLV
jgi:hypothetical protein